MIQINKYLKYYAIFLAPAAVIFISLFIGRYPVSLDVVIKILGNKLGFTHYVIQDTLVAVVWDIRFPRAILGALVGGSLATSGAAFQGMFRNPLVNSGILGVSAGAGFGASLAIILFNNYLIIYAFAVSFSILAVFLSYLIGRSYKMDSSVMLVLGGTIVSSVFTSMISLMKYIAEPTVQLPKIVFWLMGSMASGSYRDIAIGGIPMVLGMVGLIAIRWQVNVLSMGDKEARTLGVRVNLIRAILVVSATLATAGAVCVSGIIGWVGLVIPHIGRMLVGNDNRILIPTSLSLGACYLILIDNLSRTLTGSEIPLGILTALIGAPFFVYLLRNKGGNW